MRGSTNFAATARNAPSARAASPSAGHRRWMRAKVPRAVQTPGRPTRFLLPPPLRGRVGEGGLQRRFVSPPPPTPPRKGEGSEESPGKGKKRIHSGGKGRGESPALLMKKFPPV